MWYLGWCIWYLEWYNWSPLHSLLKIVRQFKGDKSASIGTIEKYGYDYTIKINRNICPVKIEKYILLCPFFNLGLCGMKTVKSASCIVSY